MQCSSLIPNKTACRLLRKHGSVKQTCKNRHFMVDGVLIPVSNCSCITVDFWGQTNCNVLAAFLTHAHADHIQGLKDSWNGRRSP